MGRPKERVDEVSLAMKYNPPTFDVRTSIWNGAILRALDVVNQVFEDDRIPDKEAEIRARIAALRLTVPADVSD